MVTFSQDQGRRETFRHKDERPRSKDEVWFKAKVGAGDHYVGVLNQNSKFLVVKPICG